MPVVLAQMGLENITLLLRNDNFVLPVYLKSVSGCVLFLWSLNQLLISIKYLNLGDLCLFCNYALE
jgi:hypothetical protein